MAVDIGLSTAIRWAQLEDKPKFSAMKSRARGGAQNPHDKLFAMIRAFATRRQSREAIERLISEIANANRKKSFQNGFTNFCRHYGDRAWSLETAKKKTYPGRKNILQIRVRPHLIMVSGKLRHHVIFWNNKSPILKPFSAHIGMLLLRQVCEKKPGFVNTYEVADLTNGVIYELRNDMADEDYVDLTNFINEIESDYVAVTSDSNPER